MKYISSIILAIGLLLAGSAPADAQAVLSLTATSTSAAPTINATFSVFTQLKNESLTDTFNGSVDFLAKSIDSILPNPLVFGKPAFAGGSPITLAPQQSMSALFTFELIPSYFKAGPDIIIVWPVAASVQIRDSAVAPIYISPATGIDQIQAGHITAYVYDDYLSISKKDDQNGLRRVQIYDLIGNEVATYDLHDGNVRISLHQLPAGVYVADIMDEKGYSQRLKFVK